MQGQHVQRTFGGIDNPHLTPDLDQFAWQPQPAGQSEGVRAPGGAALGRAYPVAAHGRPLQGQRLGAWLDDYYQRIHFAPDRLALGNIVSTQVSAVQVWNAFLQPRTLTAITGLAEGLEVSGQPPAPLLFAPLQEREWEVSVTPDGPPVVDTVVAWVFDNGAAPGLRITANRIIAWSWLPDWAEGVLERLSWATDILQSETGVEQRRAIRLAPRRELEAMLYIEGRDRQRLDMALFGWGSRVWALPIWPDVQWLRDDIPLAAVRIPCTTAHLDFLTGGMALLCDESGRQFEVVEVSGIDAAGLDLARPTQHAWPARSRLYPARPAQLLQPPDLTRLTDQAAATTARFLVLEPSDHAAAFPATTYRGRPVFADRPDESEDLTSRFARLATELDSGAAIPLITDVAGRPFPVLGHRWLGMGRVERASYRALLYALCGRQQALWVPSHADDLTLVAPVSAVATALDVVNVGYTRFGQARPGRRDIRIELRDGRAYHRHITGSSELDGDTERLLLDAALGVDVAPAQVLRISWLVLCRLDQDTVEIQHDTDSEGLASSRLVFRGVRDDEF